MKDRQVLTFYSSFKDGEPERLTFNDLIFNANSITTEAVVESIGFKLFQLNPTYQSDQLSRLVQKTKASLIVTATPLLQNIRKFSTDLKVLLIDVQTNDIENNNFSYNEIKNTTPDMALLNNIRSQITPEDLMYYGCTSGSTGDPKICTYTNQQFTGNIAELYKILTIISLIGTTYLTFVPFFTTTGHIIISGAPSAFLAMMHHPIMEKNGFLKITGRLKEMILRGGHNIWPNEIVDVINRHPKIQETAVIGIPDKFQGESVVAFVIIKEGCKFDNLERELREFLKDKLVPFSIPTYYFDLPEFPRNSSRKVFAPKLKEMVQDLIKERYKKLEENNHDKPTTDKGKELAELWKGVQTTALVKKYYENIPFNFLNTYQTLANEIFGEINIIKNKQRGSVAVTGAMGYLGIYIVNELSKRKEIDKIYCIGRSSNQEELKSKMLSMMRKVNIELNDKIELVIGDVTKKDCGIEPTMLEEIKRKYKALIYCVVVVNWNKIYGQLKDVNVIGVINAMRINETLADKMPKNAFGYIQTKWLSENYVKKGKEIGISSTIIRPCYIIADSKTGICNTDDFIYKFIRQCIINKIAPADILLNFTPVDKVAKGIVDYMNAYTIINLFPSRQTSTNTLFNIFNEKYNQSIQLLEKDKWMAQFLEKTKNDEDALSIVPSLIVIHKNYEFTTSFLKGKK
ncbi:hypothetical protein PIROE2DRAFT_13829 [Piromyces sp. E2]|nr:hypothetical protein PIROE2DRAFT_13829 [Piromyces sp. E2]|eukprot:OUM60405.1 hypothetical protein PIROE2DRAFT_13829 [Piromyces sp. E2]